MILCQISGVLNVSDRPLRMIRILGYENYMGSVDVFDGGDCR